jgi:hypothetical protein
VYIGHDVRLPKYHVVENDWPPWVTYFICATTCVCTYARNCGEAKMDISQCWTLHRRLYNKTNEWEKKNATLRTHNWRQRRGSRINLFARLYNSYFMIHHCCTYDNSSRSFLGIILSFGQGLEAGNKRSGTDNYRISCCRPLGITRPRGDEESVEQRATAIMNLSNCSIEYTNVSRRQL